MNLMKFREWVLYSILIQKPSIPIQKHTHVFSITKIHFLSSKPLIYNIVPNNLTKDATCRVSDCLNLIKIGFLFEK